MKLLLIEQLMPLIRSVCDSNVPTDDKMIMIDLIAKGHSAMVSVDSAESPSPAFEPFMVLTMRPDPVVSICLSTPIGLLDDWLPLFRATMQRMKEKDGGKAVGWCGSQFLARSDWVLEEPGPSTYVRVFRPAA